MQIHVIHLLQSVAHCKESWNSQDYKLVLTLTSYDPVALVTQFLKYSDIPCK